MTASTQTDARVGREAHAAGATGCFDFYVITANPSDFPGKHVVRRWRFQVFSSRPDVEPHAVVDTLDEARASIPAGRSRFRRAPADDPVIVETWL